MFILLNILGIFFGNEIIKYLDLECNLPWLSYFFKLRAKFKRDYLFWNIIRMFVLCVLALGLNILVCIAG